MDPRALHRDPDRRRLLADRRAAVAAIGQARSRIPARSYPARSGRRSGLGARAAVISRLLALGTSGSPERIGPVKRLIPANGPFASHPAEWAPFYEEPTISILP